MLLKIKVWIKNIYDTKFWIQGNSALCANEMKPIQMGEWGKLGENKS